MKSLSIRMAVACACALWGSTVLAASPECTAPRKTETMDESTYNGTKEATELLAQNKHAEAIEKLQKLTDKGGDYDKAIVWSNLGFAYNAKNDYVNATKAFAKALAPNKLPMQHQEQLTLNLGQLYIVTEQWDEGIKTLQKYIADACTPPAASAHIFLANALSQQKRYKEALPEIDQAIAKSKKVEESWLQLKLAVSYELKDFKACAETLVALLDMKPVSGEYWRQLSGMFLEMGQDKEAVAVLALAERQGFVTKPQEFKNLYSIYMMIEAPYKAGMLMQSAMDQKKLPADEENLDLLANAWINARESARAETTLKKLASIAEKGDYYFKLGAMYGDEERWKDSIDMLKKALEKGGLKRPGEAWMRLAVAHYGLKDLQNTTAALQKAITFDETRKQAGEWLRHIGGSAQVAAS
jgi:tetratricopeptide (TPR) repeat protein